MQKWSKLESFICEYCYNFTMSDELLDMGWPRLETLHLEGVPSCPPDNNGIKNYLCLNSSIPDETCPGVSELLVRKILDSVDGKWRLGSTLHRCVQPACDIVFNQYLERDDSNDGLLNYDDGYWNRKVSLEQLKCIVNETHKAALQSGILRQSDLDLYPREEVEQGLTYYEKIAWNTDGYLTCRDCHKCVTCELTNPSTANTQPSVASGNGQWDCSVKPADKNEKKICKDAGCPKDACKKNEERVYNITN